jgi:branched-chain amino acid transport system substrate-binding protein
MGRDAAQLDAGMAFAGGETLRAAPGHALYPIGTLMIALPIWEETADKPVLDAFAAADLLPEGYALPAYAAVQVAVEGGKLAQAAGKPMAQVLTGHDFSTAIGPVRFDEKGDLSQNLYRAFRFNGVRFVPIGSD